MSTGGVESLVAVLIFALTYFIVGIGRLPGFRIDRTGAAVIGAGLMVGLGLLPIEEAYQAINADTIVLLFGVMVVVANLRLAGFFRLIAVHAVARARTPLRLLAITVVLSGVLSAFFVNDTICLVMTPLVLEVALALEWNPRPFLLAVATAANVGSAATITGNPQNMMIGGFSGIPFNRFLAALGPVSALGLLVCLGCLPGLTARSLRIMPRPLLRSAAPACISRCCGSR